MKCPVGSQILPEALEASAPEPRIVGKRVKPSLGFLFLFVFGVTCTDACADTPPGRDWAGACSGCHGTDGRSEGAIPSIAGMRKDKFVQMMQAFRDGTRPATVMHQHAKGLSEEQIDAIGDYYASRPAH